MVADDIISFISRCRRHTVKTSWISCLEDRSQCRGDEESKGENSFLNLSMEMGLSEVFFPHGNFQGKNILAYRSRLFENELQETTI